MVNDRREAPRLPASLHAQIETEAGRLTIAITQDLSATGLLSALVSDDWGDAWAWFALGLPLAVMAWHSLRRSRA